MKIIHCDGLDGYITRLDWRNGVPHPDAGPIERAVRFSDSDAQAFMDYLHREDRMLFSVENAPESAVNHEILSLLWEESDDDGTLQESRMRELFPHNPKAWTCCDVPEAYRLVTGVPITWEEARRAMKSPAPNYL